MSYIEPNKRLIYAIPGGFWDSPKSDSRHLFRAVEFGGLPYWCFGDHGREFTFTDFRRLVGLSLSDSGLLAMRDSLGPWEVERPQALHSLASAGEAVSFSAHSWHLTMLGIQRAWWLWGTLRRGESPTWTRERQGQYPLLRPVWPTRLQLEHDVSDYLEFEFTELDFTDLSIARQLGRQLLAQMIQGGLQGVELQFGYDLDTDSFRIDIPRDRPVSLRVACWLMLRDLAGGLNGRSFCSECSADISARRGHTVVCSPRCQQRRRRRRIAKEINIVGEAKR